MKKLLLGCLGTLVVLAPLVGTGPGAVLAADTATGAETPQRMFFLHHSTGRYLLEEGNARAYLDDKVAAEGLSLEFWDHDYNYIGLTDPDGNLLGYDFRVPDDNTDLDGLHTLWTTDNAARDSILTFDRIAFKSCFPNAEITTDEMLAQYQAWYLEIRDVLDQYPEKTFLIMGFPPLHRLDTNREEARRSREFNDWLGSSEYLGGHPNLRFFNFFDYLANPDDDSEFANMLRYEYELSHTNPDSHPNALANQTVAPHFIDALVQTLQASPTNVPEQPAAAALRQNYPNPFNPSTNIRFEMKQEGVVSLRVMDARGKLVRELLHGTVTPGEHVATWNGRDAAGQPVASGVYFYRLETEAGTQTRKMVLTK